jgi:isopenicillin N synthase-like dioxygenase
VGVRARSANHRPGPSVARGRPTLFSSSMASPELPVVDVAPLRERNDEAGRARAAAAIGSACRELGFFYAVGHGIQPQLAQRLRAAAASFFALPEASKRAIAMERGGSAWRGWFPLGGELTSGEPDLKEGLYFGAEVTSGDPRSGKALQGPNLFPVEVPELRQAVLDYMAAAEAAGQAVLEGLALALGLDANYFRAQYTAEPTTLFRVFRYPPAPSGTSTWGVGEHCDYGLLTLLDQGAIGGLQVRAPSGWIDVPPLEGSLVCNLGDMLDRLTAGELRSTPHRVRNAAERDRLALAFFLDPALEAEIVPLPGRHTPAARGESWDGADPLEFRGTYGDYLLGKIAKVFPELARDVLDDSSS